MITLPQKYKAWRQVRVSPLVKCDACKTVSASISGRLCVACDICMKEARARIEKDILRFESAFGVSFLPEPQEEDRPTPVINNPSDNSETNEFSAMIAELALEAMDARESQSTVAIVMDNECSVEFNNDELDTVVIEPDMESCPAQVSFEKIAATIVFDPDYTDEATDVIIPLTRRKKI